MQLLNDLQKKVTQFKHIFIYGAGFRAKLLIGILCSQVQGLCFEAAVVTEKKTATIDLCWDLPVWEIKDIHTWDRDTLYLIGTVDKHAAKIRSILTEAGYSHHIHILQREFEELKKLYISDKYKVFSSAYAWWDRCGAVSDKKMDFKVYMVKSEMDRTVSQEIRHKNIIPIQGGAANARTRVAALGDAAGDTISEKNKNLNEFTVLYWIWKNAAECSDYIGLCHYRRVFDMDSLQSCLQNEYPDVILAQPELLFPTNEAHYEATHYKSDFLLMKKALKKIRPDYYSFAEQYFEQEIFIPYNMMVVKQAVFKNYAAWIFGILEELEKDWRPYGDTYQDRALAFLGEWLTGVYFLFHSNELKIIYMPVRLLETTGV